ncbi:MAG: type II toxin-antitoxin system RelE family toxin [Dermatophilaceae bacterium]
MTLTPSSAFHVRYDPRAAKELRELDRAVARRIAAAVDALAVDPRPAGVRALTGSAGLWRIRVGDHRVVYSIRDAELVVIVVRVAHRSQVYRDRSSSRWHGSGLTCTVPVPVLVGPGRQDGVKSRQPVVIRLFREVALWSGDVHVGRTSSVAPSPWPSR